MDMWLSLTDYSSKYKVSVSTLRRRIKSEDIKYLFQDGKYFIFDEPIKNVSKISPSLNFSSVPLEIEDESLDFLDDEVPPVLVDQVHNQFQKSVAESNHNPNFLETLKKSASVKLPSLKDQTGALNQGPKSTSIKDEFVEFSMNSNSGLDFHTQHEKLTDNYIQESSSRAMTKEFSNKISKIGQNEPILTAANKLVNELKLAYGKILQEKEEQLLILKEEVSDLKTLVKVLEKENEKLVLTFQNMEIK